MQGFICFLKVGIVIGCGILSSCSLSTRAKKLGESKNVLRWAIASPPETLDWTRCRSRQCLNQAALVMEGLTAITNSDSEPRAVPQLAAEWQNPSSTDLVFKLKPNIIWSNGESLRARHFLEAWRRLLSNPAASPFSSLLFPIVNAKAYAEGRVPFSQVGISAANDFTIEIKLAVPSPNFPMVFSHPATWPVTGLPTPFPKTVLGPFMLERLNGNSYWRYLRNPTYHGSPAALDAIEVRAIESASTRIDLFINGETDLVDEFPDSFLPSITQLPGLTFMPTSQVVAAIFNTSKKLFNSFDQRQAVQSAINNEEMVRLVGRHDTATNYLFRPLASVSGWAPGLSPSAAKSLLSPFIESGKRGPTVPHASGRVTIGWNRTQLPATIAENLQAQLLKTLDMRFDLIPWDSNSGLDQTFSDGLAITLTTLSNSPLTTNGPYDLFLSSNLHNPAKWRNRTFDNLLVQAQLAASASEWLDKLRQAEDLVVTQESVVVPLLIKSRHILRRPQVKNLNENPIEIWDFRDTTI